FVGPFFAEPSLAHPRHVHAEAFKSLREFFTDVQTVGEFAAKNGYVFLCRIYLDHVLATELCPVHRAGGVVHVARHHQRAYSTPLGDDVVSRQRFWQAQPGVDVGQNEAAIFLGGARGELLGARVRGADARAVAHGNGKKQTTVTGKESHDATAFRQAAHDQVHALGQHVAEASGDAALRIVRVGKGAAGIDQASGTHDDDRGIAVTAIPD